MFFMPYKDKKKQAECARRHYLAHKDKYHLRNRKQRQKLKNWLAEVKTKLGCSRCGESHPATLDFHHQDPKFKEHNIGEMVLSKGKIAVEKEILKCVVLCSNCHRIVHWESR